MDQKPEHPTHRPEDGPITVTRSIPLPWIISVLAAIAGQATVVYFTQQRQGEILQQVGSDVKVLSATVSTQALDKREHEFKLADHERRLSTLERKP